MSKNRPGKSQNAESAQHGIIWLASFPKSGNTWTRNFLHNLIGLMSEDLGDTRDINAMNKLTQWEVGEAPYRKLLGKPVKECSFEEIAAVRPQVQSDIAMNTDGLVLMKTHHALVMDRGYPVINMAATAGAIYIVRNPLDVAISFQHHSSITLDESIKRICQRNLQTGLSKGSVHEIYGSWAQNVDSWTRKPNRAIYVMRYEDMLTKPQTIFADLARHLLMSPSKEELKAAIKRSSFEQLQKQEEKEGFREKPKKAEKFFRAGKSDQWKEILSRKQIETIIAACRPQMEKFGYIPESF